MALSGADQFKPIGVPFRHLVNVVQMADFDLAQVVVILRRNGYTIEDEAAVQERAGYAMRWIREFAPEDAKFSVQRSFPDAARDLGPREKEFLGRLADRLAPEQTGEAIHALVYDLAKEAGLEKTTAAFEAIYRVFLGRARGPRAGWFLAFLDRPFVLGRLREAATGSGSAAASAAPGAGR
jgi:lysyl-tRNA synthetase class 1